ncbi:unnamed protein product [Caenorhabditis auriculariae]|uniref:Centriolar and ciliogenesis-associated protein HYLS1 C-terminal domain-containing protein n=1 Tax=Caenorhabditis auriculariae TaxID=2777116 RepID=A0A8S1GQE0_9PELO|nr:unnamed protein product [Caenorhabditis auriculariae]
MNSNWFTDQEIEDVLQDMGEAVPADSLPALRKAVNEIAGESESSESGEDLNESWFSSLCIDDLNQMPSMAPVFSSNSDSDASVCPSPIAVRVRDRNGYHTNHISDNDDSNSLLNYPEVEQLINDAYRSIGNVYNSCTLMDEFLTALKAADMEEESRKHSRRCGKKPQKAVRQIYRSKRPSSSVSKKPGRAPFKYDPVTRYHLYKEEWERHPAPGENRRLSLRWKIREFMLRADLPRLNKDKLKEAAEHPKDWSPRPYLD